VPEPIRHDLDVDAGGECDARVGVPEVVQPDDRQAGVVGELLEVPGDVLGSQRPSVLAGEDQT
jgi:hypothetical protein